MAKHKPADKSIVEKFTETVKGLADSASQALKAEEPARVDKTGAADMPFAAEALLSDPLMVRPVEAKARKSASLRSKRNTKTTMRRAGVKKRTQTKAPPAS